MAPTKVPFIKAPWLALSSSSSRVLRGPNIIIFATISTFLILAIMREQVFYLLGALAGYTTALPGSHSSSKPQIEIPPGLRLASYSHSFRISIFEDLHFGEDEYTQWAPAQDRATLNVMATILAAESPDLVVLNGDLITGENTFPHNSTSYLDMLLGPIVGSNIPFATVYGNHDNNANISTSALFAREMEAFSKLSLTGRAVSGSEADVGVSNYFFPVYFSESTSWQPDLILWFFDSKGGGEYDPGSPSRGIQIDGHVDQKVVHWFTATSSGLKAHYGTEIPGLAFVHIPVSAMAKFQEDHTPWDAERFPGLNQDDPLAAQHNDSAFLNAIIGDSSIKAVFSAHDHGDDWCMPHKKTHSQKMFFCMGRHTGYGGYSHWMRGSRIVEFDVEGLKNGEVKTWTALEDGSAGQIIMLNSTYGEDRYEIVPKRCSTLSKGEVPCDGV